MLKKFTDLPVFFQILGGIVIFVITLYLLIFIGFTLFETPATRHERLCYQLCQQGNDEACSEFYKLK